MAPSIHPHGGTNWPLSDIIILPGMEPRHAADVKSGGAYWAAGVRDPERRI